jgi:hypothetical protein
MLFDVFGAIDGCDKTYENAKRCERRGYKEAGVQI